MYSEIALVFDVNVWIDAAVFLNQNGQLPGLVTGDIDSPQTCASCFSWFAEHLLENLNLFSDDGIQQIVLRKLTQPSVAVQAEDRGLGLSYEEATACLQYLNRCADSTGRSYRVVPPAPVGSIGEDFEDRRVFGVLEHASRQFPEMLPLMITNDRGFAQEVAMKSPILNSGLPRWAAMSPRHFVNQIAARAR